MNRGEANGGYTIVETLIFLAVSAVMFGTAMMLISGQQNKAMFVSAVRDFETKLADVTNDISTGYASNPGNLNCSKSGAGVAFTGPNTSGDCIFIGTALKFGEGAGSVSKERFLQVTMAGLRLKDGTIDNVSSLGEAAPEPIPQTTQVKTLQNGASVECIALNNTGCTTPLSPDNAAIGFFTSLYGSNNTGGALRGDLLVFPSVGLETNNETSFALMTHGDGTGNTNYGTAAAVGSSVFNPANGVTICLKSGTTNQYALVRIGSDGGSKLTVSSEIRNISGGTSLCQIT